VRGTSVDELRRSLACRTHLCTFEVFRGVGGGRGVGGDTGYASLSRQALVEAY